MQDIRRLHRWYFDIGLMLESPNQMPLERRRRADQQLVSWANRLRMITHHPRVTLDLEMVCRGQHHLKSAPLALDRFLHLVHNSGLTSNRTPAQLHFRLISSIALVKRILWVYETQPAAAEYWLNQQETEMRQAESRNDLFWLSHRLLDLQTATSPQRAIQQGLLEDMGLGEYQTMSPSITNFAFGQFLPPRRAITLIRVSHEDHSDLTVWSHQAILRRYKGELGDAAAGTPDYFHPTSAASYEVTPLLYQQLQEEAKKHERHQEEFLNSRIKYYFPNTNLNHQDIRAARGLQVLSLYRKPTSPAYLSTEAHGVPKPEDYQEHFPPLLSETTKKTPVVTINSDGEETEAKSEAKKTKKKKPTPRPPPSPPTMFLGKRNKAARDYSRENKDNNKVSRVPPTPAHSPTPQLTVGQENVLAEKEKETREAVDKEKKKVAAQAAVAAKSATPSAADSVLRAALLPTPCPTLAAAAPLPALSSAGDTALQATVATKTATPSAADSVLRAALLTTTGPTTGPPSPVKAPDYKPTPLHRALLDHIKYAKDLPACYEPADGPFRRVPLDLPDNGVAGGARPNTTRHPYMDSTRRLQFLRKIMAAHHKELVAAKQKVANSVMLGQQHDMIQASAQEQELLALDWHELVTKYSKLRYDREELDCFVTDYRTHEMNQRADLNLPLHPESEECHSAMSLQYVLAQSPAGRDAGSFDALLGNIAELIHQYVADSHYHCPPPVITQLLRFGITTQFPGLFSVHRRE